MQPDSLTIRRLTPDLAQDFLQYFEGAAFADNPKWKSCYCQFLYVDHSKVNWSTRTAEENRAAACDRIVSAQAERSAVATDADPSKRELLQPLGHGASLATGRAMTVAAMVIGLPRPFDQAAAARPRRHLLISRQPKRTLPSNRSRCPPSL